MKSLKSILNTHSNNKQKIVSSLVLNQESIAINLLKNYEQLTYDKILDSTIKVQAIFRENADQLINIESSETQKLDELKTIKNILTKQLDRFEDKEIVLDATIIEKQQYQINLDNLRSETEEKKKVLEKKDQAIKEKYEKDNAQLSEKIAYWKSDREKQLKTEKEQAIYDDQQMIQTINDEHHYKLLSVKKELDNQDYLKEKEINQQRKILNENNQSYKESLKYIEDYDKKLSTQISNKINTYLKELKHDHKNKITIESNNFINKLDILDIELSSITNKCDDKKQVIDDLKNKLAHAKVELNKLTQNTLTI